MTAFNVDRFATPLFRTKDRDDDSCLCLDRFKAMGMGRGFR
jgi:hypothetical protein